jgi:hypothetical protein
MKAEEENHIALVVKATLSSLICGLFPGWSSNIARQGKQRKMAKESQNITTTREGFIVIVVAAKEHSYQAKSERKCAEHRMKRQ